MSLLQNSSELLALLCVAGVVAAVFRWHTAQRRDFLLAFIVFLAGAYLRELVVYLHGPTHWPPVGFHLSAAARLVQIAGAVLFVRAAMHDRCGEWGWIAVVLGATLGAILI